MKKMIYLFIGFGLIIIVFTFFMINTIGKIGEILKILIQSDDFSDMSFFDSKFTCDGLDLIPSLNITNLPKNTKSLVLIVEDPDAPAGVRTHFIAFDILTNGGDSIKLFSDNKAVLPGIKRGKNSANELSWHGPCPPKGSGNHRYVFKVFAINKENLGLKDGSLKEEILDKVQGFDIASGEIIGLYQRK